MKSCCLVLIKSVIAAAAIPLHHRPLYPEDGRVYSLIPEISWRGGGRKKKSGLNYTRLAAWAFYARRRASVFIDTDTAKGFTVLRVANTD